MNRRHFFRSLATAAVAAPVVVEAVTAPAEQIEAEFSWDDYPDEVRGQWSAEAIRARYATIRPLVP